MSTISLILADEDEFFSERFGRYILEHNSIFDITTFTKYEYLIDYLSKGSADILLIDKNMVDDTISTYLKKGLVIILDDTDKDNEGDFCHISKYQKTEDIVKKLTFKYAESIGDKSIISADGVGMAKIVSVYSPIGGSGKTTVALALAAALAKRGHKVIYFSMEKFNSAAAYLPVENVEGLSEIFLRLKNKGSNISFEIMKRLLTDQSGVNYFAPPESAMEFNEMSTEELTTLIKETANTSEMSHVIVDLPSEFNDTITEVMKLSNDVVFVATPDNAGLTKTAMFMKEVNIFANLRIVYEKFIPIVNKSDSMGIPQGVQDTFGEKSIVAAIPNVANIGRCQTTADIISVLDSYIVNVVAMI